MKTSIKSFEIIKKMYEYFVEKYRDLEPKLMICEKEDFDNVEKSLKALEIIKDICKLKVYKNKLGQCFLEGINILFAIPQETYDLLKEVLL